MNRGNNSIAVAQEAFTLENGVQLVLAYSILHLIGPEDEDLYGIRVEKRYPNGNLIEMQDTAGITGSIAEAKAIAEAFAAGTVPPCALLDMIAEWQYSVDSAAAPA